LWLALMSGRHRRWRVRGQKTLMISDPASPPDCAGHHQTESAYPVLLYSWADRRS